MKWRLLMSFRIIKWLFFLNLIFKKQSQFSKYSNNKFYYCSHIFNANKKWKVTQEFVQRRSQEIFRNAWKLLFETFFFEQIKSSSFNLIFYIFKKNGLVSTTISVLKRSRNGLLAMACVRKQKDFLVILSVKKSLKN